MVADAAIEAEGAAPPEAVEQVRPPIPLTARETPHEAAASAPERARPVVVAVVAPEIQGRRHPSLDEAHLTAAAPPKARSAAA